MLRVIQELLFVSLISFISFVVFIIWYYKRSFKFWEDARMPHPKPSFPFGNMPANFSKYIGQSIEQIYRDMKAAGHKYCGYYMFAMPVFMPICPSVIKHVLTVDFYAFCDRGFHSDEVNDPMGVSLVTAPAEKWKKMREKVSPAFTTNKTKMMLPIVLKYTKELEKTINDLVNQGNLININDLAKRYTVDVICSAAFGVEGNSLQNPNSEFIKHAKMIFTSKITDNMRLALGQSAPYLMKLFKINLFNPVCTSFFKTVVEQALEYREKNNIVREDFLNLMIRLRNNESISDDDDITQVENVTKNQKTEGLSVNHIASHCFLFFLAGFETSSSVIQYALYELAKNEDIQNRLRQEIIEVLKKYPEGLNYESIRNMRYLDNVFNETLRKYPVVHMLNRISNQDYRIPETDIVVKKGTRAVISTLGLHKDPEFYPDPEKFDPNRFSDEIRATRPSYTFLPFGDGPRICPGLLFGTLESKIAITNLILRWKFSTSESITFYSAGSILASEKPIYLKAEKL